MATGFRGSNQTGGNAISSLSPGLPSTRRSGDVIIMCLSVYANTTMSITANSSGWNQVGTTQAWFSSGRSTAVFWKISNGTEGDPTVTFGATADAGCVISVYSGADQTNPVETYSYSSDSDTSSTTIPAPALTISNETRIVLFGLADSLMTQPTGFIERTENASGGRVGIQDKPSYASGTVGGWNVTSASAGQHAAWSIALKEDPARREPAWEATGANVTSTSGAVSLTPSTPTSIQNDDLMLLELLLSSSSATVNSVPSGWTLVDSTFSGQARLYTYRKYYDGSIGSFGFSATIVVRAANSRFTSPNPGAPVDSHTENSGTAGTTVTFPAVTPVGDGLLAYAGGSASAASQTNAATIPTNATERYDASTASASGSVHTFGGTNGNVSAGVATSTFTSTLTNSADWAAQTIVLANPDVTPPAAPTGLVAEAIGV